MSTSSFPEPILPRLSESDIKEFQADIKKINDLFYEIGSVFLGPRPTPQEVLVLESALEKEG